ncbi:bleomycin resistance protein [Luteimonas terrae]|uniref:Bleomycin resistance protein n=1 Tax=Luteimonas terrae TaxID=1530191 RepID=A0ABU1XXG6_9GAMM|nr:VOC family protein [Luteimonas terrae]MDR7193441.1 catechol 2,3-dioxygenase-like lactoylglutathione lyase family enzyme [Luteimonas terrae]
MLKELYWNALVPELTVDQIEVSLRFYTTAGFSVRFRRHDPAFAYLELGQAQLMLEQQHERGWNIAPLDRPLGRGINFQIEVPDADAVRAALVAIGATIFGEVKDTWYSVAPDTQKGQREFLVQDPDGYLLRFAQHLGSRGAA